MYNELETTIRRGEVYYIYKAGEAPGNVQNSGRPGIIVSNDMNNRHSLTYEIVYLTTKEKNPIPTHCTLTTPKRESTALCEQIQTVSNEQLGNLMCTLTDEEMAAVDRCLAISLGLALPDDEYEDEPDFDMDDITQDLTQDDDEDPAEEALELYTDLVRASAERDVYKDLCHELLEIIRNK